MALQTSGAISLNDIHIEAGGSSGTSATINDSDIRGLIGKASGAQMSFSEWYGAEAEVVLTSATAINGQSNRQEITASTYVSSGGTLVIPANFWVWSDNTATAALIIDVPCTIKNYGNIIGKGGEGGTTVSNPNGFAGGPAIKINPSLSSVTIINYSGAYIAGGGGGGAAGSNAAGETGGGGGAGGGLGGGCGNGGVFGGTGGILNATGLGGGDQRGGVYTGPSTTSSGLGGGGDGGGSGGCGGAYSSISGTDIAGAGGGGGRILSGTGGSNNSGVGGDAGNAGTDGGNSNQGGGGGGWGAAGGNSGSYTGGSGGAAIAPNASSYSLTDAGTIYGSTT